MNKTVLVAVITAIVVGAGAFFGGMMYGKNQTSAPQFAGRGQGGIGGNRGGRFGNGNFQPVRGNVISQDANSLTVKLNDGSSKIVLLSGTTTFEKSTEVKGSDIKQGDVVAVVGTANSDGSVTAQNVQINPPQRMFGGSGTSGASGSSRPQQ